MELLLISLAPVVIIGFYIWSRDKYEREPVGMVVTAMVAGALLVIPILAVEGLVALPGHGLTGISSAAWNAFAVAGFTEELFKYLALYLLIWKSKHFNDKYDGIVYASFISLGFAGVENIMYILQGGFSTGLLRAITAVPAHAIFGITMGFYFGIARFHIGKEKQMKARAFWVPFLLHGIYDFILMTGIEWLWLVFTGYVVYLYMTGLRLMKTFSDQSYFRTDFDLLNRKFGGDEYTRPPHAG